MSSSVAAAVAASAASGSSLVRVVGVGQQYDWGKVGSSSAVAQLLGAPGSARPTQVDADKPYAELWMGTHPSGPASVVLADGSTQLVSAYLGGDLPFLFKVLSVGKALSIQAHPDAALGRRLHADRPHVYKDPCHKPELACALTPFEALCAFRPIDEIQRHAHTFPEFAALLGEENRQLLEGVQSQPKDQQKATLKRVFTAMMTPKPADLHTQLTALLARLKAAGVVALTPACEMKEPLASKDGSGVPLDVSALMVRLSEQYPGDVGIFAPLYLNAFALAPGQAMFLGPNEPHAYLSGDCMECMACSDNVVRAGLTPKLRDTDVLVSMLTYETHTVASTLMTGTQDPAAPNTTFFSPPRQFSEFRLLKTALPAAAASASAASSTALPVVSGASILICWSGSGSVKLGATSMPISKGSILLVPSAAKVQLERSMDGAPEDLMVYQCASNAPPAEIKRLHVGARLSETAVYNGTVYLAGQIAENTQQDIVGQTREVLGLIDTLLGEVASDKTRILMCQIFLSDMKDFAGMNQAWDEWVPRGHAPPRATVESKLANPACLVEICITAAVL